MFAPRRRATKLGGKQTQAERQKLISRLSAYRAATNEDITLVFDGARGDWPIRRVEKTQGIQVIYSGGVESADDEIERLVRAQMDPSRVLVVSSDAELRRTVGKLGTKIIRSADFNRQVREAAERMAINMPVQGTSADIIKVAMINLYREINKRRLRSKMLLQVHDELVFEVPAEEMGEMSQLAPRLMSTAIELSVPLKVDTNTGSNWGEMK